MIPDNSRSRDHRGVTWERRLARSTRSYIGTAVERAVEEHSSCIGIHSGNDYLGFITANFFEINIRGDSRVPEEDEEIN